MQVKHDAREAAYDSLRMAVSDLKGSKHEDSEECIQRLINMVSSSWVFYFFQIVDLE